MGRKSVYTPECIHCHKRLTPNFKTVVDNDPDKSWHRQLLFKIKISGYGFEDSNLFCSSGCGFNWAKLFFCNDHNKELYGVREVGKANLDRGFNYDGTLSQEKLDAIQEAAHDKMLLLEDYPNYKKGDKS